MVADIVISANFSDGASRILAGSSEETLQETAYSVADVGSVPLNAVKMLGSKCGTAVVISRVKDNAKGWCCTRKSYRRVSRKSGE